MKNILRHLGFLKLPWSNEIKKITLWRTSLVEHNKIKLNRVKVTEL